jgi:uncharacterized membrane protein
LARAVQNSLSVGVVAALAAYPLLVYAAIGRFGASGVAAALAALCVARLAVLRLLGRRPFAGAYLDWLCLSGVLLAATSLYLDDAGAVRYYPVLVNAALLLLFGASLKRPPTIIERIARLRQPELPPAGVAYTRRVTIVWTVFFVLNGSAAFYTAAFTSLETWAWYNGFVAYLLIGALFLGELAFREYARRRP